MITDNIFVRILEKICDIFILNILWVVCSIPVVTAGAATTAMYAVLLKMVRGQDGYVVRGFLESFKKNVKQSTKIWLLLLVLGGFFVFDFIVINHTPGALGKVGMIVIGAVLVIYMVEVIFVFPLVARFENTTLNMLKNGLLIPATKPLHTLLLVVMDFICIFITLWSPVTAMQAFVIWATFGVALVAYANAFLIGHIFRQFEPEEVDFEMDFEDDMDSDEWGDLD